jgi:ribosome maturation factor RimP
MEMFFFCLLGLLLKSEEKLGLYIEKVLSELELELVEFDLFRAGKRKILRIYIDHEQGVTVEDCANVSRQLGELLELENVIEDAYTLEVSSPGIDRPLKSQRDFARNVGRFVKVTLEEEIAGRKWFVAELLGVDEENILVKLGKDEVNVPRQKILNAKIELQF